MNIRICGLAVLMVGAVLALGSEAGNTNSPAAPTDAGSAMYRIEDIYNRLNAGTAGAQQVFTDPPSGPAPTMQTLNEVMQKAPAVDAAGATSNDVVQGKTFWCLTSGAWGTNTGTRAPAPVATTGQTYTYDQTGALVTDGSIKDDGYYKKGVAAPRARFTVVDAGASSNCVIDNLTGLMWLKNPDSTARIWTNAIAYCEGLDGSAGRGGYTDWRLPNRFELESILDFSMFNPSLPSGHPFLGVVSSDYWSSTTFAGALSSAWVAALVVSFEVYESKGSGNYVWPVRGGQ